MFFHFLLQDILTHIAIWVFPFLYLVALISIFLGMI